MTGNQATSAQPDPDLVRVVRDTVAVVDAPGPDGAAVAVWHIDVGPDNGLARPCGAWLLAVDSAAPDCSGDAAGQVRALVRGRRVLATGAGAQALARLHPEIDGYLDGDATVRGVGEEIELLQRAFEQHLDETGRKFVPPAWPEVPAGLDPDAQGGRPDASHGAGGDDGTATALELGRRLADLADTWQQVERQRLARRFLRKLGGDAHRSLPVVLRG
ncbi:DUF6218 family protein [Tomitella fengzijianii]|uniref:Uncharacterized protein n=1 Tax=Tomitella fengzijianii TaxID=2597660 RepID=A0A516WZQ6_9ACTN|nr:DUF6218 family protein [Tomitella fengzijianii]QDQ96288.1 hypothetical protein FO059_01680 [Tomitella fengzijianii]